MVAASLGTAGPQRTFVELSCCHRSRLSPCGLPAGWSLSSAPHGPVARAIACHTWPTLILCAAGYTLLSRPGRCRPGFSPGQATQHPPIRVMTSSLKTPSCLLCTGPPPTPQDAEPLSQGAAKGSTGLGRGSWVQLRDTGVTFLFPFTGWLTWVGHCGCSSPGPGSLVGSWVGAGWSRLVLLMARDNSLPSLPGKRCGVVLQPWLAAHQHISADGVGNQSSADQATAVLSWMWGWAAFPQELRGYRGWAMNWVGNARL